MDLLIQALVFHEPELRFPHADVKSATSDRGQVPANGPLRYIQIVSQLIELKDFAAVQTTKDLHHPYSLCMSTSGPAYFVHMYLSEWGSFRRNRFVLTLFCGLQRMARCTQKDDLLKLVEEALTVGVEPHQRSPLQPRMPVIELKTFSRRTQAALPPEEGDSEGVALLPVFGLPNTITRTSS